jgi:hypothetical protein
MTDAMKDSEAWYIVKQADGHCEIVSAGSVDAESTNTSTTNENAAEEERWGPFASQSDAIARRVGLIRSGKCQPV